MKIIPHRYQVKAVKFLMDRFCAALFLDLGLGKTVVVLTWLMNLLYRGKIKGALVIAPLRVVYNVWPAEIEKWDHTNHLKYCILHGKNKDKELKKDYDIYLMNYDGISWLAKKLEGMTTYPFNAVVYDESTAVKSADTQRFRLLKTFIHIFKYRTILTGTPAPNTLLDVWAQYYLLDGGERLGTSRHWFKNEYFWQADYWGREWEPMPSAPEDISEKVSDITMRLKAEDYLEMPKLLHNEIRWSMPTKIRKKYLELERNYIAELSNETITAVNAAALSQKLRQFVSGFVYNENKEPVVVHTEKLSVLEEIVEGNSGENLLVAIQFRYEYEIIKSKFPKAPVIYGGMNQNTVRSLINKWNNQELSMLVVHPASIAHGVNLQHGGHTLVWYGIPWSFEHYSQLLGRLYRQGQGHPVSNNFIIAKGSVEEKVVKALCCKEANERSFLLSLMGNIKNDDNSPTRTPSRAISGRKNKGKRRHLLQMAGDRFKRSA